MALAWLVPNHYLPWVAFHSEVAAAAGFAVLAIVAIARGRSPAAWPALALLTFAVAAVPLVQAAGGLIAFWGDAWMASLYLLGFALAIVVGHRLGKDENAAGILGVWWFAVLAAAVLSVGVALSQWLSLPLGLLSVELPPGGRPFGNLAQPNHLATLLALGLVAVFALAQMRIIGRTGMVAAMLFLLIGLAMAGSRTTWLQVGALSLWLLAIRPRVPIDAPRRFVLAMPVVLALASAAWPSLDALLSASQVSGARDRTHVGTRPIHWASMLDAVSREPVTGYGWNQVSVAQARVANDHPASHEMIEHSHNLVLDLMVWNGIPLGMLILVAFAAWTIRHARAARDPNGVFLLAGVAVVLIHAMTEFPLEYAYFLLPLGLMIGMAQALSPADRTVVLPRVVSFAPVAAALALLTWTVVEYVELEEAARVRRLEVFGILGAKAPNVSPVLLTQQGAFWAFTRQSARPGMTPGELDAMQRVAERYGYPPVLLRYALASALNGRPDEARAALSRLCKTHSAKRCEEGAQAWRAASEHQFPQLRTVAFPAPVPRALAPAPH